LRYLVHALRLTYTGAAKLHYFHTFIFAVAKVLAGGE
jgi:hypothetical protein